MIWNSWILEKVVSALVLTKILLCIGVRRRHSATVSLRVLMPYKVPNASSTKSPNKTLHLVETGEHKRQTSIYFKKFEVNHVVNVQ